MKKVLSIFGEMADRDIEWLARSGEVMTVIAGQTVVTVGEPLSRIFIVLEGELNVELTAADTVVLGTGEIIGELSFIDRRPPSATVVASIESKLLAIDKTLLEEKLSADSRFAANFFRALAVFLSTRLRGTVGRLGYGNSSAEDGDYEENEIDLSELTNAHLGGERFDRLLKQVRTPEH